jgi:hypothetical protein
MVVSVDERTTSNIERFPRRRPRVSTFRLIPLYTHMPRCVCAQRLRDDLAFRENVQRQGGWSVISIYSSAPATSRCTAPRMIQRVRSSRDPPAQAELGFLISSLISPPLASRRKMRRSTSSCRATTCSASRSRLEDRKRQGGMVCCGGGRLSSRPRRLGTTQFPPSSAGTFEHGCNRGAQ